MNLSSTMAIPKIEKIIINMGVTQAVTDKKYVDSAVEELSQIAGQRAVVTRAKKSIANFKLRQGMPIGCRVTLRGERMYDFLERLIFIALPRVRDFQGIPRRGFDGNGNYNLGIKEHTIFPEISFDKTDAVKGLNITIVTTADNDDMARTLLERVGLPFRAAPKSQENK
ncbi:50S ribosomal protein L5 [Brachyspira intermedia PWS/A]|nr:50S ribosomal protein L5 [Brachyspira intermedia PWS/A]